MGGKFQILGGRFPPLKGLKKTLTVSVITFTVLTDFGTVVDMFEVHNGAIYITNVDTWLKQLGKDHHHCMHITLLDSS